MFAIRYGVEPVVELWECTPPAARQVDGCTQSGYVGQLGLAAYAYIYREPVPASNVPTVVRALMPAAADIAELRETLGRKSALLDMQLQTLQAYVLDAIDTVRPGVTADTLPSNKRLIVFKNMRLLETRPKAYHVCIGLHDIWLPRSQAIIGRDPDGVQFVAIPLWLANKHSLLAYVQAVELPAVEMSALLSLVDSQAVTPAAVTVTAAEPTAPRGTVEADSRKEPPF